MSTLYYRKNVEFRAEGTTLRGWLYQPKTTSKPVPAIVMAHGYNCIKELYLDKFAECFAKIGFAVLAFDNRNFGDSDGHPRQELDPWQQVRDYRHAITFMQTQAFVNPDRIGIWGTSYSGGHVLVVAALDNRVKCVVSQVPTISGWQSILRRVPPTEINILRIQFNQDRQHRFNSLPPTLVPMITNPNEKGPASHGSQDAWNFFTGLLSPLEDQWRFTNWRNEVTLRSIEMYSEYEPGSYIERIAPIPLLMIVANNDVVAVTDLALDAFNRARDIKKLHLFRGGHFSAYIDAFDEVSHEASQWFKTYLL
ncbi:MAG: alpha/beta fold hydrolase [Gammaproteobacteria bacterium]|nr:alpha/beta fold hydrolase [Gammaproteobacteria bacterium]